MNKAEFTAAQRTEHACGARSLMGEPWEWQSRRFTSIPAVGRRRPGSAELTLTVRSRPASRLLVGLTTRPEYAPSYAATALAVSEKTVEALMAGQGL